MNQVFLVGNITGDIYFDRFLINGNRHSFLRLVLIASRPRRLEGMRIILWDENAQLYFPYLKKGSELAVMGQLESHVHKGRLIHEIVADHLLLLRNIDWQRGEKLRQEMNLPVFNNQENHIFVVGRVMKDIHFEWQSRDPANGGKYAYLWIKMRCDRYLQGLRVGVFGDLAELAYPYLQSGSKIAVDGHLQTHHRATGQPVFEVAAHNLTFLENINWTAGEAARHTTSRSQVALEDEALAPEPVSNGN